MISDDNNSSIKSIQYVDHFSLRTASTTVRFRHATVHVYGETVQDQFLIEERLVERVGEEANDVTNNSRTTTAGDTPRRRAKRERQHQKQLQQHDKQRVIIVKRLQATSFGLQMLRATYTLVAFLVFGFLVVFCFQIIIFLVFNMLIDGAHKNNNSNDGGFAFFGALLSVPMFLYSIANVMCLGWTFVTETWSGHKLCRHLFQLPPAATEWLCFVVFLGLPAITMATTLFSGNNNWWEVTAGIWIFGVATFGLAFALCVVVYEAQVYVKLIRIHQDLYNHNDVHWLQHAMHVTQNFLFSGVRYEWFLVNGTVDPPIRTSSRRHQCAPLETRMSWYSRLTQWSCCTRLFYERLATPQRIYSMMEVRDEMPFLTRDNWSLETMFCHNHTRDPMITVTTTAGGGIGAAGAAAGRGALRPFQLQSTLVCQLLGQTLLVILVVALISWMHMGLKLVLLFSVLALVFCIWPLARSSWLIYNSLQRQQLQEQSRSNNVSDPADEVSDDEEMALFSNSDTTPGLAYASADGNAWSPPSSHGIADSSNTNVTMLQVWEKVRVTKPRIWLCYVLFAAELFFLFAWPLWNLFNHGNTPVGVTFVMLGAFAFARLHFSAAAILTELGPLQDIPIPWDQWYGSNSLRGDTADQDAIILHEKARISDVVGRISRGPAVGRWIWFYGFAVGIIFFGGYMAATSEYSTTDYKIKGVTLASGHDFAYPPRSESNGAEGNLPYQTCSLHKGFGFPSSGKEGVSSSARMIDYAFLATMAYTGPSECQPLLDAWFGPERVKDEYEYVQQYRTTTESWGGASYKLFSFPNDPEYGIVSIRGSEMILDWLSNMELWSSALLLQLVRNVMPIGQMWTPLLHHLAYFANSLESSNLRKVAYYRRTTQFVEDILKEKKYTTIRVTGASLGGGIAIITGAQTGASTVAISGPNAMISRKTFDPPLTVDQLDTRILNVIPDRDYIARIDDPGRLYQRIDCRAPAYSLFGCHSMWRTLCEFAYQCGSDGRPVLCWCATKYGYPAPVASGNITTWEDACVNNASR